MKYFVQTLLLFIVVGCTTSPGGRRQLILMPANQMAAMGDQAFQQMQQKTPRSRSASKNRYVRCVTDAIVREVNDPNAPASWDVVVFEDKAANAFALPGGNIGVYTGLLNVAQTQGQLAAVIGHEIAHVTARHGNERYSQNAALQLGSQIISVGDGSERSKGLMAALGLGLQVGVLLPFGRAQESEADRVGLEYLARAGFDPRESVRLWQNMARAGGGGPPEFLSTHPSEATRIRDLQGMMNSALAIYNMARAQGKRPSCRL